MYPYRVSQSSLNQPPPFSCQRGAAATEQRVHTPKAGCGLHPSLPSFPLT